MPWTGESFQRKHAKKLKGKQAAKAAAIANAILAKTGDEGRAIRGGISAAKKTTKKKVSK